MRLPLTLYVMALVARTLAGALHPEPAYPDSTYYVAVARSLAEGHGFSVDFIWNFVEVGGRLPSQALLPIPSNAHWMPLASLIQVPFIWLFGQSAFAAFIPFALIGATAAPLTWAIARDAGLPTGRSLAAGLMAVIPGGVMPFLGQPDNFALYMPLGALALWLCGRGLAGDRRSFVLGGLVVGLATLARNDGVLLGVPFALGWLRQWWIGRRRRPNGGRGGTALPIGAALGCAALFLVVMGPWYLRQELVFGALSPSASNGRILWITSYPELFSVGGNPTFSSFLAQGIGPLLASRAAGLLAAIAILAAVPFLFFLVPFVLGAAWAKRRSTAFGPWIVYAIVLLALSGLLFAIHVPYGTFLHSAVALVPHGYVLAVEGIALAVAWTAQRRRHWDVPRATRNFTAFAVLTLWIVGIGATWKAVGDWETDASTRRAVATSLAPLATPGDRLMSADPGAYRYFTGLGGVVTPADPLDVIGRTARLYDIRWLVLERAHIVAAFGPVYLGTAPLPDWLALEASGIAKGPLPPWHIYAVCAQDDPRPECQRGRLSAGATSSLRP